ncbi:hypothetical protein GS399_06640 [Pedobacter sp. HMF7647]|uniref:DUF4890 domain-containing protein n=1 Tax=Hufsiella arboris TaxID=2695275 RepID=A0A7K1Y7T4_9SPHI|nr:hypothetical protein [Hufsiella arboris]MXV50645.1 hypothetical protein [Hufsiella arboris]
MKKLIFGTVIMLGFATASFAQQDSLHHHVKKTPEQRAEMTTNVLDKKLALTSDQKAKIYAINLERAKKMETMRGQKDADHKAIKSEFAESDKQINDLLTDSQKKTYADFKAQQKQKMEARAGGRGHKRDIKDSSSN